MSLSKKPNAPYCDEDLAPGLPTLIHKCFMVNPDLQKRDLNHFRFQLLPSQVDLDFRSWLTVI
jgi:hypothetical protein